MAETQSTSAVVRQIDEMMTYFPTREEFNSPIEYIEKLIQQGAQKYGCIKIVPPEEFKPALAFDVESETKLPSRF